MSELTEYQKDIFYTILEQRRFMKSLNRFEIKYIINSLKSELRVRKYNKRHSRNRG